MLYDVDAFKRGRQRLLSVESDKLSAERESGGFSEDSNFETESDDDDDEDDDTEEEEECEGSINFLKLFYWQFFELCKVHIK